LHKKDDYEKFWDQRTVYKNSSQTKRVQMTLEDEEIFKSLLYASYQIPRLLLIAHLAWFKYKTTSNLSDRIAPLQTYENDAIEYYSEMSELLLNPLFKDNDIPHILMCCGVRWEVRDVNSFVPGTKIPWSKLISMSVVFPYLDNCYIIPFSLMWAAKTPSNRYQGDYTKTRAGIVDSCKFLIPNFDINNLFVSYDHLRQLNIYNLGICYESLFASSLAVKYYLCELDQNVKFKKLLPLLEIYDVSDEDASPKEILSEIWVDFSSGIMLPEHEYFVDSSDMPNAIIHNSNFHNAHHDIILPANRIPKRVNGIVSQVNIAVSCKASFDLSADKTIQRQLKISKENDARPVDLLIWVYLGNLEREEQYQNNVAFMNGNGCCNGLAVDMFIMTKNLHSQNNR
jgi:hypothetical protein